VGEKFRGAQPQPVALVDVPDSRPGSGAKHFFYLLSEGSGAKTINGVSYDSPTCNGSTVTGIGRAAAEKIWYQALTAHFTSGTKYSNARTQSLAAAADLYGSTSTQYRAVAAAWSAVSVN
jgi:Zn-dependent metalloprotease